MKRKNPISAYKWLLANDQALFLFLFGSGQRHLQEAVLPGMSWQQQLAGEETARTETSRRLDWNAVVFCFKHDRVFLKHRQGSPRCLKMSATYSDTWTKRNAPTIAGTFEGRLSWRPCNRASGPAGRTGGLSVFWGKNTVAYGVSFPAAFKYFT